MSIFENIARAAGRQDALDLRERAENLDGTQIIREEEKIPAFIPGKDYSKWPRNSPVTDAGQVWLLLQPYDSKAHPGNPGSLRAMWGLAHTKDPDKAKPWVDSYGASGMYMTGECYLHKDGTPRRAKQDNLVYDADALPSAWEKVEL